MTEDVIADLTIDGVKHEFTLLDLEMLVATIPISKRNGFAANPDTARIALITEMYMQRYPYESGGDGGAISTEPEETSNKPVAGDGV